MDSVRIRLVFEERNILSKSQRKNRLKRSWILLKSHLHSISDFSSYLIDVFRLRDACPDGLILSMDGFVLPPFEPTSVLKDRDIVRVKKKEDNVNAVEEMANMVGRQPAEIQVQLLADEELVKECIDCKNEAYDLPYQLEDTLDVGCSKKTVSRKRKALKTLHNSKMKKIRSAPTAKCLLAPTNLQQSCTARNRVPAGSSSPGKSLVKKQKSSNHHTETDDFKKRNASELQNIPSLEKDKKQLMWQQVKTQKEKVQQQIIEKSKGKLPDESYFEDSEQLAASSDDKETVPVVITPGHVRFLPLGQVEANHSVHPAQASMDTLGLNGITIKKGQKWSKGKSSSWKSNSKNCEGQSSKSQAKRKLATVNCPIDFLQLRPCASLPKRGDIIAYRLIELSSSWTPELSSFRVGKVSWCKPEANKIMLIPVPEYPFLFKKAMNEEPDKQVNTSPYAEDGSLKADYSSLVDIRIVEHKTSTGFEAATDNKASGTTQSWNKWESHSSAPKQSWNKWESHSSAQKQSWKNKTSAPKQSCNKWKNKTSAPKQSWKKWETHTRARENGKENAWDEIVQALSAKKTTVSNEVRWKTGEKKAWEGAHNP